MADFCDTLGRGLLNPRVVKRSPRLYARDFFSLLLPDVISGMRPSLYIYILPIRHCTFIRLSVFFTFFFGRRARFFLRRPAGIDWRRHDSDRSFPAFNRLTRAGFD